MLIKNSIDIDMFNPTYKELEALMEGLEELEALKEELEKLDALMEELEELNQGYKQGTQSWDL